MGMKGLAAQAAGKTRRKRRGKLPVGKFSPL
jgi:hypothetical protein